MNEPEARAAVEAYKQKAVDAIRLLGEMEPLPAEFGDSIEDCRTDLTGSPLDSGKIASESSWNVEQVGNLGYDAVEEALAEDSMEVSPYSAQRKSLSAEAEGFQIVISFREPEGTSGRVGLTVRSPCIDGI